MRLKGFVVAMHGEAAPLSPVELAASVDKGVSLWLIVSRWGASGNHLTVAKARAYRAEGAQTGSDNEAAPIALEPESTLFAALTPDQEPGEGIFLLCRALPPEMLVAGDFVPADGYVRLTRGHNGLMRLVMVARDAALFDNPQGGSQSWHIVAEQHAWGGEWLDCSET